MGKRIVGASRLRRKLKRMPDAIQWQLRSVIREQVEIVRATMAARAPVSSPFKAPKDWEGKPRAHIRDAIEVKVSKDGLRAQVGFISAAVKKVFFYALYLEFGTKFMRKQPFVFPAWREKRKSVRDAVVSATKKALADVASESNSD